MIDNKELAAVVKLSNQKGSPEFVGKFSKKLLWRKKC